MPDVWAMARYWKIEPPLEFLFGVKWGYNSSHEPEPIVVAARNVTPFEKLPKWLRGAMVKRSGKTEDEYKLLVKQKRKEMLLRELEEKRKENGGRTKTTNHG